MNDSYDTFKEAADWPGTMTMKRVFTKVQATWIRVMSVAAASVLVPSTTPVPEAADPDQVRAERAMVACAAQIIAEKNAKDAGRPHEPRGIVTIIFSKIARISPFSPLSPFSREFPQLTLEFSPF
jgi:hypothetical protein